MLKFIRLGEEPYPQIPPNGKWLSPKFQKSEIGNFRKQNDTISKTTAEAKPEATVESAEETKAA